jgi:hypothetical protein
MRHSKLLVVVALTASSLAATGCVRRVRVESPQAVAQPATQVYAPAPTTVLLAQAQPPQLVRAAVIRSLTDLGYQPEGEDGQRVIARYARGREVLRIQVEYWPTQATISYLGSEGLRFRRDGSSPHYERWTRNLSGQIQGHVAAMARQGHAYGQGQVIVVQPAPAQVAVQPAPTTVVVQPAPVPPATVVVQPAPATATATVQGGGATVQGTIVVSP